MGSDLQTTYAVARMYYLDNFSQVEISQKLNLSRAKVSRLLSKARQDGIVQIKLVNCFEENLPDLQDQLVKGLGIANIQVVPSISQIENENLAAVSVAAAKYFSQFIRDEDLIGVSWGYTLLEIAKNLPPLSLPRSSLVQLVGNLDNADSTNYAHEVIRQFGKNLGIENRATLPCPVIVENSIIVDLLLHDSKISSIVDQINKVDVAFVNVATLHENNCLLASGYISAEQLESLRLGGAVGCICSRFIDIDGNVVNSALNDRTIGVTFAALNQARISCVCIAQEYKIAPLLGAIKAGLINTLVIDSNTANSLLYRLECN